MYTLSSAYRKINISEAIFAIFILFNVLRIVLIKLILFGEVK